MRLSKSMILIPNPIFIEADSSIYSNWLVEVVTNGRLSFTLTTLIETVALEERVGKPLSLTVISNTSGPRFSSKSSCFFKLSSPVTESMLNVSLGDINLYTSSALSPSSESTATTLPTISFIFESSSTLKSNILVGIKTG